MLKKLLGLLAVIGTIFGAVAGAKKSKELKELENKIDESKKEEKNVETKIFDSLREIEKNLILIQDNLKTHMILLFLASTLQTLT